MPKPRQITHYGNVTQDGILKLWDRVQFSRDVKAFTGYDIKLTLSVAGKNRSNSENRYYWGVIVRWFTRLNYDVSGEWITDTEVHEKLKRACNPVDEFNEDMGKSVIVGGSTAKMTTIEFEDYAERCRMYIFECFDFMPPLPNEDLTDEITPDFWNLETC